MIWMKKLLELNELLKNYLDIDFIYCNNEIAKKINNRIKKQFTVSMNLEDLTNKVYKQKVNFEPIKKNTSDSTQAVSANIKELFKEKISNPDLVLSLENLGYSYETISYYIETEEEKMKLGIYNEPVIKLSNMISKAHFLTLLENMTKKEIDFSKLEYLTWEEVAPALNREGYASTCKCHNPNIFKNIQSIDGTILCKYLDFTNYQGYKSDDFFPKNIYVTINPLEYFYEKLSLSEKLILFNESCTNDIKQSIPELIDENQIIEQILLIIKDEIVKKVSKYIDLIDNKYIKGSENGVTKFDLDINKSLDFHYINHLSEIYKLDVPEFTIESLKIFKNNILEIENNNLKHFIKKRELIETEKFKIEIKNKKNQLCFKKNKSAFLEKIIEFERLFENGEICDPNWYLEDTTYRSIEVEHLTTYIDNIIYCLKAFLNDDTETLKENQFNLEFVSDNLDYIERMCNEYMSYDPQKFYVGNIDNFYEYGKWDKLPYQEIKLIIKYIKSEMPFLNDYKNGLYSNDTTKTLDEQEDNCNTNIYNIERKINYDIEQNIRFICDEIEKNSNIYDALTNIIGLLDTINKPNIFNETIIEQLYELLKVYGMLSNRKISVECGINKGQKESIQKVLMIKDNK